MRILLIESLRQSSFTSEIYPPLGLYYIASFAKKYAGFEAKFDIISASDITQIEQVNLLDSSYPPDIIGISATTEAFTRAGEIAGALKKKFGDKIPIILGGCHISALPESLPTVFDAAVIGEGEVTFLEILSRLKEKGKLLEEDFACIPGIAFYSRDKVLLSPSRPPIPDLDIVPIPSRRIVGLGITHIMTSRGCPHHCVYCATRKHWGNVRCHSPAYVLNEVKILVEKMGIRQIIIFDDNFLAVPKRVKEISDLLFLEGLSQKVEFICYGRTRAINQQIVEDLVRMGVKEIYLGADSIFDNSIEGEWDARAFSRNTKAIDICHRAGLKINCSFVIGLPCQTTRDLDEIYDFLLENRPRLVGIQISPVNLFPGTPLWEYTVKKGKIPRNVKDWSLLENFTPIFNFSPEKYIYLNEKMDIDTFTEYCRKFVDLL